MEVRSQAPNPLMQRKVVLHCVAGAEVGDAIPALGQVPLEGVNLEGLAVAESGVKRSAFGQTAQAILVETDLAIILPAILIERMAGQVEPRRQQTGDGAFPTFMGPISMTIMRRRPAIPVHCESSIARTPCTGVFSAEPVAIRPDLDPTTQSEARGF